MVHTAHGAHTPGGVISQEIVVKREVGAGKVGQAEGQLAAAGAVFVGRVGSGVGAQGGEADGDLVERLVTDEDTEAVLISRPKSGCVVSERDGGRKIAAVEGGESVVEGGAGFLGACGNPQTAECGEDEEDGENPQTDGQILHLTSSLRTR